MSNTFRKYLICISVIAIAIIFTRVPSSCAETLFKLDKPPLFERWFGIYVNDERCGFHRQNIVETTDGYRMESDHSERLKVMWFSKEAASREVYHVNDDLALRSFEIEHNVNGAHTRLTGRVANSVLRIQIETNGKTTIKQLKLKGDVFPGPALNLYPMMRGVQAGKTSKVLTFGSEDIQIKEVAITVVGEEAAANGFPALRLSNNLYPVSNDIWMDGSGNTILESVRDGLVVVKAEDPKEMAPYAANLVLSGRADIDGFGLVRAEPAIKNIAQLKGLSLEISDWNDSLPLLREGQFVEKAGDGKIVVKTGSAIPAAERMELITSFADELSKYLVSSVGIESEALEILSQAKKISEGKTDRLEIVKALSSWTSGWLQTETDDSGGALAGFTSRKGNNQTRASLYTAMARAANIPTRFVSGLASKDGKVFFYHSWAESFVSGRWITVDPTLEQVPADAAHLKFFEGNDREDLAPIASIICKINIKMLNEYY